MECVKDIGNDLGQLVERLEMTDSARQPLMNNGHRQRTSTPANPDSFRLFAETDAEAEGRVASRTIFPVRKTLIESADRRFQAVFPPPRAAALRRRPSGTPHPHDRAPSSLSARIPSQNRYGAPQYSV
ncbi:hypothetical protein [Burkholderia cepacia]|uniref:hypothetical protein n=1 Tax=Burkholderia cepacia TaxID=292 RepID=UPI000F5E89C7|nr:hypothetical protein [Burkholderia cepacia]